MHGFKSLLCAIAALLLPACSTLMYAEQTGFNLSVKVNSDKSHPLSTNAGFERNVVTIAPPKGDDSQEKPGEAVSMLSFFDLKYEKDDEQPLLSKLTIQTRFASGGATDQFADDAPATRALFSASTSTFTETGTTKRISDWLKLDQDRNLPALKQWVGANCPEVGLTALRFDAGSEALRDRAIRALDIP